MTYTNRHLTTSIRDSQIVSESVLSFVLPYARKGVSVVKRGELCTNPWETLILESVSVRQRTSHGDSVMTCTVTLMRRHTVPPSISILTQGRVDRHVRTVDVMVSVCVRVCVCD